MEFALFKFSANINSDIFIKDPESSQVGSALISSSIDVIYDIGFEEFTFRKLAQHIGTTEATVYRYFENKHKLLLYLTSWYWCWVEYQLMLHNTNIEPPTIRLKNAIKVLCSPNEGHYESIDLHKLFKIICSDSSKSYLTKNVDNLNSHGVYYNYKKIVSLISQITKEINPQYEYPNMLVTTIIEGIHHQIYFADHLPSLTDKIDDKNYLINFYFQLINSTLNTK